MGELELSEAAQHWFNVVLIWIGFGTLAGLMAKALMPSREPSGAVGIIVLGILGSALGPLALSLVLRQRLANPIGPLGLLAAVAAALLLMILYQVVRRFPARADDGE